MSRRRSTLDLMRKRERLREDARKLHDRAAKVGRDLTRRERQRWRGLLAELGEIREEIDRRLYSDPDRVHQDRMTAPEPSEPESETTISRPPRKRRDPYFVR